MTEMTDEEALQVAVRAAEAGAFREIYARASALASRADYPTRSRLTAAYQAAAVAEAEALVGRSIPALAEDIEGLPLEHHTYSFWLAIARDWNRNSGQPL